MRLQGLTLDPLKRGIILSLPEAGCPERGGNSWRGLPGGRRFYCHYMGILVV
jgi:hypothetical protein